MELMKNLRGMWAVAKQKTKELGFDPESAFSQVVTAGIMAIMIGAILLVISYVVISALITAVGNPANATLNTSMWSTISTITQALTITGVSLIIVGIAIIIYTLAPMSPGGGGRGR
jgi:hypothetical protein